ncbi:MAG: hypothetical protein AB7P21_30260 [Lautropia sp.]
MHETSAVTTVAGPVPGAIDLVRVIAGVPVCVGGRFATSDELRALWHLLPETSAGSCVAQLRDVDGRLVDERRVHLNDAARAFGEA